MDSSDNKAASQTPNGLKLSKLTLEQVVRIDEMMASIGDYGEVQLVIQHGELRYINRVESHKAWKENGSARGTE